jgi:uncharacterized protein YndB with AHSA1/START domain
MPRGALRFAPVDPITVSTTISVPREQVFEYLADIANHAEFTDHYLVDWHLTRVNSYGTGAGARFRMKAPLSRFSWAEFTLEVQPPYKIVERGCGGKYNRIRMLGTYTLSPGAGGTTTKVDYTLETVPALPTDRLMEIVAGRAWMKRKVTKAMRRLRTILEDGRGRGRRASVAGA